MRAKFHPIVPAHCARCGVEREPEKLGVCPECGSEFCGEHILDHPCPMPLEVV